MATITVERPIAADPTSTALLLAGPTALDLWPGVTLVGGSPGHLVVDADVPALVPHAARVLVRALPPRRLPTSYVTRFTFAGEGLPETEGSVTLAYASAPAVPVATRAAVTLTWSAAAGSAGERARVSAAFFAMAEGFLANLAAAAEERSDAA
ncbi:MAG TPA: hypothetical protein VFQ85_08890 [Mycobacteriales bacterium]|jgi:hypothetical protein|nr:hypothetical protein [Mycobacteriales bacterium]